MVKLRVQQIEVVAVAGDNARLVVLPGKSALTVGVLPGLNGVRELSGRTILGINRAEIAIDLAAVLRAMVAVEPVLFALIDAVSGPAVLVREVVDGVPEREVALNSIDHVSISADGVASIVVQTVSVNINPGNTIDILRPVTTVALRGHSVGTKVDVVLSSEGRITELMAVVRSARVIVALPVLFIELTSKVAIEGERETVVVELSLEALTVLLGTRNNGTGADADTTGPITIAASRANGPLRPSSNVAGNLGETLVDIRASAKRSAGEEDAIRINSTRLTISSGVLLASKASSQRSSLTKFITSPGQKLGIIARVGAQPVRIPKVLEGPVLRAPEQNVVDVKNNLTKVEVRVVDTIAETTTMLIISALVVDDLGNTVQQARRVPGEVNGSHSVRIRVAVGEAVKILNEGKVANTTIVSLGDDRASANASHEEVITTNAIVFVSALAPIRPLGEHTVNRGVVNLAEKSPSRGLRRRINIGENISSVVQKSHLATRKQSRRAEDLSASTGSADHNRGEREAESRRSECGRTSSVTGKGLSSKLPDELADVDNIPRYIGNSGSAEIGATLHDEVQDLDVVNNVTQVGGGSRVGESSKRLLVLVKAVLIRVGNVGNEVSISVGGVTVVVEATTAILLGRFATVRPIIVKIAAELRLASTVITIGRIKARVEVMDSSVAIPVSHTLIDGGINRQARRRRRGSPAAVGVVGTKSTLEKGAINALILTAGNIGLVGAARARTIELSLATVTRILVAISKTGLAGEEATTSGGGGSVTVAEDRATVDNVGEVDVLRAINGSEARDGSIGLRLLATGSPVVVDVTAESLRAGERALFSSDIASGSTRLSSRKGGTVNALTTAAASVEVEDAVSLCGDWATTLINLTTVNSRTVAVKEVGAASVRAGSRGRVAHVLTSTLSNSLIEDGIYDEGIARHLTIDVLKGSLATKTLGEIGAARIGGSLATVGRITVAVRETIVAGDGASTKRGNIGRIAIANRGSNIVRSNKRFAVGADILSLSTSVTLSNGAGSSTRGSRSANTNGSLATVRGIGIAVTVSSSAVGGGLADTTGASNTGSNVGKARALGATGIAVVGISLEVDGATVLAITQRCAERETSAANSGNANTTNAVLGGSILKSASRGALTALRNVSVGVHFASVGESTVAVLETSGTNQRAGKRRTTARGGSEVTSSARNLAVGIAITAKVLVVGSSLTSVFPVAVAILEISAASGVVANTSSASESSVLDSGAIVSALTAVSGGRASIVRATNTRGSAAVVKTSVASTLANASIANRRAKVRESRAVVAARTASSGIAGGVNFATVRIIAVAIQVASKATNHANTSVARGNRVVNIWKKGAVITASTAVRNVSIHRGFTTRSCRAIIETRLAGVHANGGSTSAVARARGSVSARENSAILSARTTGGVEIVVSLAARS